MTTARGLDIEISNKFFKEFKEKFNTPDTDYCDVRILWDDHEYKYTIEEFKKLLGLSP